MIGTIERLRCSARTNRRKRWSVDIFNSWWLTSFGLILAALYLLYMVILYCVGSWIVDRSGVPIYTDFGCSWVAGIEALRGAAAKLSDPAAFSRVQAGLFPANHDFYPNWPYPPTFFLLLAPLGKLPYRAAFLIWDVLTLSACLAVVYLVVRRRAAVALALAAPFTAWNFLAAQNGFLTSALIGATLLTLERQPLVAGIALGGLTYKPQFGLLFPVALIAARQWRAIASAALSAVVLAGFAAALFGTASWTALPHEVAAQSGLNFLSGNDANWGYLQSVYGFARHLHVPTLWAWLFHALAAAALAGVVWRVWRSAVIVFRLKAATLSAAALLVTPYAFTYDMAALVIPAAFLAADQLERGLLPGDKVLWIGLFAIPLTLLVSLGDNAHGPTFGGTPAGLATAWALLAAALRRAVKMPSGVVGAADTRPGLPPFLGAATRAPR